jgi:protoporphyrin/coproporphyrin ferrochelatase
VRAARDTLPAELRDAARVVFTAHSVPAAADAAAGTRTDGGHRYSRQVAEAARLVAAELGLGEYDVVWQSRSGPPQVPWLEPDVVDHLDALAAAGVPAVVVVPVGFVSDHVEVIWDLDTEARERAGELGLAFARAATAGPDPRFADMVVELVAEHLHGAAPRALSADVPSAGCTVNGLPCAVDCCMPGRPAAAQPARAGAGRGGGFRDESAVIVTAALPAG